MTYKYVACHLPRNSSTSANKMCTTADFAETSNFHCDNFCVGPKVTVRYILDQGARGSLVVKALWYKPAGRGFDSRLCHWNFSVT